MLCERTFKNYELGIESRECDMKFLKNNEYKVE